jgi:uncharacterized protein (TIGR03437 family)
MRTLLSGLTALFAIAITAAGQTPTIAGANNAGSQQGGPIAPSEQLTLFGSNLGDTPAVSCGGNVTVIPTTCSGVSVMVNGTAVPVLQESAAQVTIITPAALSGSTASVQLTRQVGGQPVQSNTLTVNVAATAPGLFSTTQNGVTGPQFLDVTGKLITAANPAKPGDVVSAYGTGFGVTNPPSTPGAQVPSAPLYNVVAQVKVTVGGQTATVGAAVLAPGTFGAVYQVNFTVPQGLSGSVGVTVNVGGVNSQTLQLQLTSGSGSGSGGAPVISGVSDFAGTKFFCPGGTMIINGNGLGSNPGVTVGGKNAYTILPPSQNNGLSMTIQIPVDAPTGATSLVVTTGAGGPSAPFAVTLQQYAPILPSNGPNSTSAQAFHANQSPITPNSPAVPNEPITVVAVGLGPTKPQLATGTSPSDNQQVPTAATPTVSIGGAAATAVSAIAEPGTVGYYLVMFTVPGSLGNGNAAVKVTIGGASSNSLNVPVTTAPVINSVVNAASSIPQGLPNSGIAQGAVFSVLGQLLGPASLAISPAPFQNTSLSGTSMSVTVAGVTVSPLLYYTSANQVSALLPSNTPTGTGTMTLTYSGQTSRPAPVTVVPNNVGIFTVTSDGTGSGIVTYPDYSLVSTYKAANCGGPYTTCGAANPGDTLVIWGTGLGPINGSDAAGDGLGVNQPNIPLTVWLGGVAIKASYQGRGCCVGEDQIIFTVPQTVPTGCAVPLSIQIDSQISNSVTLAVATGSRTCTPVNPAFGTPAQVPALGTAPATYGSVSLTRQDNFPNGGAGFTDSVKAQFASFSMPASIQPFFLSYLDPPPPGSCQVFNSLNSGLNPPITLLGTLDPGSTLTVQGPSGSKAFPISGGQAGGSLSGGGNFLNAGAFTVSAPGGADIPAFSTNITIPPFPSLTSPTPDGKPTTVSRSSGLTVTWTGGSSAAYLEIDGSSATDNTFTTGASFQCVAPASAGSFTIPPSVLLALPAGSFASIDFHPSVLPVVIPATGLTIASLNAQWDTFAQLILQ